MFCAAVDEVMSNTGNGICAKHVEIDKARKYIQVFVDRYTCDENGFTLGFERYYAEFKVEKNEWENASQSKEDPYAAWMVRVDDYKTAPSFMFKEYKYYSRPDSDFIWQEVSHHVEQLLKSELYWVWSRDAMSWSIEEPTESVLEHKHA